MKLVKPKKGTTMETVGKVIYYTLRAYCYWDSMSDSEFQVSVFDVLAHPGLELCFLFVCFGGGGGRGSGLF